MTHTSERALLNQAIYEQYVALPSLWTPAQIGALPLYACLQDHRPSLTAEQLTASATCALDLAQLLTKEEDEDKAAEALVFAQDQFAQAASALERSEGICDMAWYLDASYRLRIWEIQASHSTNDALWNGRYTWAIPEIHTQLAAMAEPLRQDQSSLGRTDPKATQSPVLDATRQLSSELAFVQLANSRRNRGRCLALFANPRERTPTGAANDAFDIKYIFPDNTWLPARVISSRTRCHEFNPNIPEIFWRQYTSSAAQDVLEMLESHSRGGQMADLADDIYHHISHEPRLPLQGLIASDIAGWAEAVEQLQKIGI